jgi:hypothetical protein
LAGYAGFGFQELKVDAVDGAQDAERRLHPAKVGLAAIRKAVSAEKKPKD